MSPYRANRLALPMFPADDRADAPPQAISAVMDFRDDAVRKLRRGYYGAIGFMDAQFGRLLAELDRLKLRENTIVVFVSDHGYLLGEHGMWKKSRLWEEAIRVPMIISAPGLRRGATCDHIVELVDLYPTITDLAGLEREPGAQGQSLLPLLRDPSARRPRTDAFIQTGTGYGLRSGQWAYMWYPPTKRFRKGASMLYDMDRDPRQHTNLTDDPGHAAIRRELHDRLTQRIAAARNSRNERGDGRTIPMSPSEDGT